MHCCSDSDACTVMVRLMLLLSYDQDKTSFEKNTVPGQPCGEIPTVNVTSKKLFQAIVRMCVCECLARAFDPNNDKQPGFGSAPDHPVGGFEALLSPDTSPSPAMSHNLDVSAFVRSGLLSARSARTGLFAQLLAPGPTPPP